MRCLGAAIQGANRSAGAVGTAVVEEFALCGLRVRVCARIWNHIQMPSEKLGLTRYGSRWQQDEQWSTTAFSCLQHAHTISGTLYYRVGKMFRILCPHARVVGIARRPDSRLCKLCETGPCFAAVYNGEPNIAMMQDMGLANILENTHNENWHGALKQVAPIDEPLHSMVTTTTKMARILRENNVNNLQPYLGTMLHENSSHLERTPYSGQQ